MVDSESPNVQVASNTLDNPTEDNIVQPPTPQANNQNAGSEQADGQNAGSHADDPKKAAEVKHKLYRDMLGITTNETKWWWWFLGSSRTVDGTAGSYYKMILNAYNNHSRQYWFIASLINTLYLLQIILGAIATALSATSTISKNVVTALTATSTVVAGILAFLKSRGQPNRVRQLRNNLGAACDEARLWDMELQDPTCTKKALDAVESVRQKYETARANADINLPDTWAIAATTTDNVKRADKLNTATKEDDPSKVKTG